MQARPRTIATWSSRRLHPVSTPSPSGLHTVSIQGTVRSGQASDFLVVSVFPNELYQAPRAWAEQAYPNLIYFNQVQEGNHFAAWQQPGIFTTEVRAAFRSLR